MKTFSELKKEILKCIVSEYNTQHDKMGRFSSTGSGLSSSGGSKDIVLQFSNKADADIGEKQCKSNPWLKHTKMIRKGNKIILNTSSLYALGAVDSIASNLRKYGSKVKLT
jgi:hypothetical protein